ncbi:MAG: M48 family metallopeptidase [Acutalibacteraceae bacterium]|jgi:predicted metal-dependent hydrolase
MEYTAIRSRRKTLGLQVTDDGVIVRVPYGVSNLAVARFVDDHRDWIARQLEKQAERRRAVEALPPLTAQDIRALTARAKAVIPDRAAVFAPLIGVDYGRITIRCQRTRWGSCSKRGDLNFNCLLMLAPPEVLDSVVIHELCHRLEMNHSPAFYAHVRRVCPDYDACQNWLKGNGPLLLGRVRG